jgi:hypothetical protein
MSYNEEQARRSKEVIETPTARREFVRSESVRGPERTGVSATTVGILVVLVIALVTILVLLLMNQQSTDTTNANLAAAQQPAPVPQTTIVQQPAPPPPVIITQPAQPAPAAPIIVTPPAGSGSTSGTDDLAVQARVDKRIADDPNLSSLGVTVTVLDGKATLIGTVKSEGVKSQLERAVKEVKGVKSVDNQIMVSP